VQPDGIWHMAYGQTHISPPIRSRRMQTAFSYIVRKWLPQSNEDVATDALAYILRSSEAARNGFLKLLRSIVPDLPDLRFRTQQTEGSIRPDLWGFDGTIPRVFVENKFWAGFTENQPVEYIRHLARYVQPTVLLVVVPAEREEIVWREFMLRLDRAQIQVSDKRDAAAISICVTTDIGPVLGLTSWSKLLSVLELEAADDRKAISDLSQLKALCDAADSEAFLPFSAETLTDQRIPALVLQISGVVQASVELAVSQGILDIRGLRPTASWDRIGRYVRFGEKGVGAWIGIRFDLWRGSGTPLWAVFSRPDWSAGVEVHPLLERWAAQNNIVLTVDSHEVAVGLDLPVRQEKDGVIRNVVDRLREIREALSDVAKNRG